jgi:RNA polymerase sigma factor (sigma-70 family)
MTTKSELNHWVSQVANGNKEYYGKVEEACRPLLKSLADRFSQYHPKLEFDDLYSIGQYGLYEACLSFNQNNPSFCAYAKEVVKKIMFKELERLGAIKRSKSEEVSIEELDDFNGFEPISKDTILDDMISKEFMNSLESIIEDSFDCYNAEILKSHLIEDKRVCDIARDLGYKYKKVHSVIRRGKEKIEYEYHLRYS